MKIGIDIDDTVTCTFEYIMSHVRDYMENVLNKQYKYIESEDEWYHLKSHLELSDEEEEFCYNNFFDSRDNYIQREGAIENLNKLHNDKNEIIFITSRNERHKENTIKWFEKHNIKYSKLIMEAKDKGEIAKIENIDIFIDDSIKHCKSVSNKGVKTFLITREYNKFYECKDFERVDSWEDFYKKINKK